MTVNGFLATLFGVPSALFGALLLAAGLFGVYQGLTTRGLSEEEKREELNQGMQCFFFGLLFFSLVAWPLRAWGLLS